MLCLIFLNFSGGIFMSDKKDIMDVFNYISTSVDGAQNNGDLMNKFAQGVCQFTDATSAAFVKKKWRIVRGK